MRSLRKVKPINSTVQKKQKVQKSKAKGLFDSDVTLPPKRRGKKDLSGPNGEGTFLLEQSFILARQFDMDPYEIEKEMKSKDYKNLIKVFDKYFGDKVDYSF